MFIKDTARSDVGLIVAELRKLREIADRLIATLECPELNAPPVFGPDLDCDCCCGTHCRCMPEAIRSNNYRCEHCGGFDTVDSPSTNTHLCVKCGKFTRRAPVIEEIKGLPVEVEPYRVECPKCKFELHTAWKGDPEAVFQCVACGCCFTKMRSEKHRDIR